MSNRVDELESKVAELQAAVNGLTEELVETKERVRLLEDHIEVDLVSGSRPVGHASTPAEDAAESDESTQSDEREPTDDASAEDEPDHLRESPAQAQSRAETSAQPSDDARFIDADSDDVAAAVSDDAADTADDEADEVKSEEADGDDEAESAEDDSDIIVA